MNPGLDDVRRRLLIGAGALVSGCAWSVPGVGLGTPPPELLFDDLERRTFSFFWDTANPVNGLVPDRWPSRSACSIAATGFGLTALPIGVTRGFISRAQARDRALATLRFFANAPQGPHPSATAGHRGFFYHFLDMQSGLRAQESELSTVDTALLLAGMLFCQAYFDQTDAREVELRQLVDLVTERVEWTWIQVRAPLIAMGWTPEAGFISADWRGYDEGMIVYLLALGSTTHAVDPAAWAAWTATYNLSWGVFHGYEHLGFAPLFGHQYSHVWVDFRGIFDSYMRTRGIDYFENSRRATYAQRAYATANPKKWQGYDDLVWGLTACDGPANVTRPYLGASRRFRAYSARGAGILSFPDDGTIAPTAAASSLPFAPEIVIPSVQEMARRHGAQIYARYGFVDAFNPSFEYAAPLAYGRREQGFGWIDTDYIGIDQGPILAMGANHRSALVWNAMRRSPTLVRGLRRAGFSGGWLSA